ncbi:sugar porter family MFS transporter [Streptomyces avermitilis]|uniref:sugar porter family MFS transporter n=1 Tax=Streptomyces avermitilis TaxID=33903 RepID=UPI0033CCCA33
MPFTAVPTVPRHPHPPALSGPCRRSAMKRSASSADAPTAIRAGQSASRTEPGLPRRKGTANTRMARSVTAIAAVGSLGGLLFGYDTGIISGALPAITSAFDLGVQAQQVLTSAIIVGAIIGALISGRAAERFGRRLTVMGAAGIFAIGATAAALAPDLWTLGAARLVLGLAVGLAAQAVPLYVAEIAPPARRGGLVVVFQLAITIGILAAYLTGYLIDDSWRWMFGLGTVPALLLLAGMFQLPESPRWLFTHQGKQAARDVLTQLRNDTQVVNRELDDLRVIPASGPLGLAALRGRRLRPALIAGIGLGVASQVTGINAIIYYAPTILQDSGFGHSAAMLTTVGVGVVNFLMVALGLWLVDRIGRRRLLLALLPGAVVFLAVMAAVFTTTGTPTGSARWLAVICILGYIACNGGSLSVVVWLIGPEIYPQRIRADAVGLSTFAVWTTDLLVSLTTLSLTSALGVSGTFWLFAAVNLLAVLFTFRYMPETRGRTLEEIEQALDDGSFRSMR